MPNGHLLSFFHQLLKSPAFHVLIIFFENRTVDTLDLVTDSLRVHPNHDVVLFNVDHNTDGIHFLRPFFTHSVVMEIYEDHSASKLWRPRQIIQRFEVDTKCIRIYLNNMKINRFFNQNRNTVIVQVFESSVHIEAFNFNYSKVIADIDDDQLFEEMFFDWTINYEGARLYMWGGMDAPNQFNAKAFDNRVEIRGLGGIYAFISRIIGEYFNASVVFGIPLQDSWLDGMTNPYKGYHQLKSRVYQTDFVIPQVQKINVYFDFYDEFSAEGMSLYPHKQENFVVLVPNYRREESALWHSFATSPLFSIWCSTITLFTIVRFLMQKVNRRHQVPFHRIAYETCGLSFGWVIVSSASSRAERLLNIFISLFAILSGIFFSGLLLQQFAFTDRLPVINTFEDLKAVQRMTIMIPLGLEFNQDIWNPNHTFVYTTLQVMYGEVLNLNTRCSYVLPESVADVLLAEDDMTEGPAEFPIFHKISQRIYSKHMSIRTTRLKIKHHLHKLMQRLVMHGLIHHFEQQTKLALRVRQRSAQSPHRNELSVTIDQLFFMLIVYWFGQLASALVFLVELAYWNRRSIWRMLRRRRNAV